MLIIYHNLLSKLNSLSMFNAITPSVYYSEMHVLLHCTKHNGHRLEFYEYIEQHNIQSMQESLHENQLFIEIQTCLGIYIYYSTIAKLRYLTLQQLLIHTGTGSLWMVYFTTV